MAEPDAGFKIVARTAGPALSRLAGVPIEQWEAIGDTLQTTERLADRAFRARHGKHRFVVYMEAYTRWADSAVWSVLAKSGLLSERERLPTRSLIFILLPQGYKEQHGQFRLEAEPGEPTQHIWFREICLWKEVPQPWWTHWPGLMALYPLCNHQQEPAAAVAHAATAIRQQEMDGYTRADLLAILGFFGKLKHRTLDVWSFIGREQMKDSAFYQEVMAEGEQVRARKDVLRTLRVRFGEEAAKEFEQAINRVEHLDQLDTLLELALRSRRVSQFRRAFPKT